jgi:hypothetical protein
MAVPGARNKSERYSAYCRDHLKEFNNELCDEASQLICGWRGGAFVALMLFTTITTFWYALQINNPSASLALLAYILPIMVGVVFSIAVSFYSAMTKYSPIVIDTIGAMWLLSFGLFSSVLFDNVDTQIEREMVSSTLASQMNFMPLIVAAFSYHAAYRVTIIRNLLFIILFSALIYWIDKGFFAISILHLLQGFLLGSLVSWMHYDGIRVRFYSRTTNESVNLP